MERHFISPNKHLKYCILSFFFSFTSNGPVLPLPRVHLTQVLPSAPPLSWCMVPQLAKAEQLQQLEATTLLVMKCPL